MCRQTAYGCRGNGVRADAEHVPWVMNAKVVSFNFFVTLSRMLSLLPTCMAPWWVNFRLARGGPYLCSRRWPRVVERWSVAQRYRRIFIISKNWTFFNIIGRSISTSRLFWYQSMKWNWASRVINAGIPNSNRVTEYQHLLQEARPSDTNHFFFHFFLFSSVFMKYAFHYMLHCRV